MQLSRILLALMLFIVPFGAHGQSPEEPCSVSADPSWTLQEKFVWERVCAGEGADFNAAPGYGGQLDPMKPDDWPWTRELRPKFLQTILFKDPYRSALTRNGVPIAGARFTEAINLGNAELEHPFVLLHSLVEKGITLRRARSKSPIILNGSNVAGTLDMYELELSGDLIISNGNFADVNLQHAHIGALDLEDSKVTGELNMNSLQVGDLFMRYKAEFADVDLQHARVGLLDLSVSKVSGELNMNGLQVGGNLFMRHAEFADVGLIGAHVNGHLDLNGSKVSGKLYMSSVQVGGNLFMSDKAEFAEVDLIGAHVGQLDLNSSKVTGKLNMNSIQADGNLFMSDKAEFAEADLGSAHVGGRLSLNSSKVTGKLNMNVAHVGGQLDLDDSKVSGELNCYGLDVEHEVFMGAEFDDQIQCVLAKIKGVLFLDNGQFKQNVDFSAAEIDGGLHLGSAQNSAQWADGVTLVLRDAKVLGTIPGLAHAWAPKLDLDGFTYRSAGAADEFENWFGRLDHYAPQPYEQLASVVQSEGHGTLATAIRYSGRERERSEATDGAWAWLTTLKWVIGYGYYPYYAMGWAIGLVIVGALVLRVSGEGPPDIVSYSFDMLLPIIKLRESHFQIDLKTWARYYFYFHKIMGYVLASFLLAGLAGLTK